MNNKNEIEERKLKIVIPISSSPKLYDTHEKILETDLEEGNLNKLPSRTNIYIYLIIFLYSFYIKRKIEPCSKNIAPQKAFFVKNLEKV